MSFHGGFIKVASWKDVWKDRLKGLVTGKRTLYHGTSLAGKRSILRKGIEGRGKGGITNSWQNIVERYAKHPKQLKHLNKGHVFLTEDPDKARLYAEAINKSRRNYMLDKHPELAEKLFGKKGLVDTLTTDKSVVKVEVPKNWLKSKTVTNPEMRHLVEGSLFKKTMNKLRGDFEHSITIKGNVPKKFVRGRR